MPEIAFGDMNCNLMLTFKKSSTREDLRLEDVQKYIKIEAESVSSAHKKEKVIKYAPEHCH